MTSSAESERPIEGGFDGAEELAARREDPRYLRLMAATRHAARNGYDSVSMRDVDVMLPARLVEGLAPRSGIRMTCDVRVTTPSLDWTPAAFLGGARIDDSIRSRSCNS